MVVETVRKELKLWLALVVAVTSVATLHAVPARSATSLLPSIPSPSTWLRAQTHLDCKRSGVLEHMRGGVNAPDEDEEAFKVLMKMSGCSSTLRLRSGERGRGLFTASEVPEGEILLTVPLDACLVEPRVITEEEQERLLGRNLSEGNDLEDLPRRYNSRHLKVYIKICT